MPEIGKQQNNRNWHAYEPKKSTASHFVSPNDDDYCGLNVLECERFQGTFVLLQALSLHLREISKEVAADAHAVLVLDGADYHVAADLDIPSNITQQHLPPYAPELPRQAFAFTGPPARAP